MAASSRKMSADASAFTLEAPPPAPRPARVAGRRVSVLLPLPLTTAYDYRLPPDVPAVPGSFVEVPLGGRVALGVVWDPPENPDAVAESVRRTVRSIVQQHWGKKPLCVVHVLTA